MKTYDQDRNQIQNAELMQSQIRRILILKNEEIIRLHQRRKYPRRLLLSAILIRPSSDSHWFIFHQSDWVTDCPMRNNSCGVSNKLDFLGFGLNTICLNFCRNSASSDWLKFCPLLFSDWLVCSFSPNGDSAVW